MTDILEIDARHHWHPYTDMSSYPAKQLLITEGKGSHVCDADGRWYIDAISGLWNTNLGHGRQDIIDAVNREMRRMAYQPLNGRSHPAAALLAERLCALLPDGLDRVFFATGGAEANETAIKISRAYWRYRGQANKTAVIGMPGGWHGCTFGALSASKVPSELEQFEPGMPGFPVLPLPDEWDAGADEVVRAFEELDRRHAPNTVAALIAETVQGLAGMRARGSEFWQAVRRCCTERDILLIVDEVAMGFGRTGKMFSFEHVGIKPDIVTMAKGITAGYVPLSAVVVDEEVFEPFTVPGRTLSHGYTWGGHPAACAAATATIAALVAEGLCERSRRLGDQCVLRLTDRLAGSDRVAEVRGTGMAIAVELTTNAAADVCAELLNRGVITRPVADGWVVPLMLPLTTPDAVADEACDALAETIAAVAV